MQMVQHAVDEGFSTDSAIRLINISDTPEQLISSMDTYTSPSEDQNGRLNAKSKRIICARFSGVVKSNFIFLPQKQKGYLLALKTDSELWKIPFF